MLPENFPEGYKEYLGKKENASAHGLFDISIDDLLKKLSILPLYTNVIKTLKMFFPFRNRGSKST